MRVVLTGGGSGGHLFPLIAVSRSLEKMESQSEFLFLGPKGQLEKKIMNDNQIRIKYVASGKARRYFSFKYIIDIFKLPLGIIQSLWHLLWFMPDAVFSKGGHAAIPVVVAAWIYRIPILTHESDSVPGVANRVIGKFSDRIAISYNRARRYFVEGKLLLTGNPVIEEINQGSKEAFIEKVGLTESRPIMLVIGGSQGAQNINIAIARFLPKLLKHVQVVHQTGEKNYEETIRMAREVGVKEGRGGYFPFTFFNTKDLSNAYSAADIVISRAGANSISEIASNKKPVILIPLPTAANNHQSMNAYELVEAGGAVALEENNLVENIFLQNIEKILHEEGFADKLIKNIEKFYHFDAADKIAKGLKDITS